MRVSMKRLVMLNAKHLIRSIEHFRICPKGSIPDVGESKGTRRLFPSIKPSGIPTPNTPEVEAYFTPVNQRHRFSE